VPQPDQLAVLHYERTDEKQPSNSFCAPLIRTLEKHHEVFENIAAFSASSFLVRGNSGTTEFPAALVTGQFFEVLQTPPLLGRYLTPADDEPGGGVHGYSVVLSERFWRTWFNSSPNVVGSKLNIANVPFTVVGVMPDHFIGADPTDRPQIYAPLSAEPITNAPYSSIEGGVQNWWLNILARRNPGVSLEQSNAALAAASNSILTDASPDAKWLQDAISHHFRIEVEPGTQGFSFLRSSFSKPLLVVLCLCAAMLLLACLNLASLLTARATARERELATRLALGASRRRLIQQLLVESLLIAVAGTGIGLLVSPLVSRTLAQIMFGPEGRVVLDTSLDLRAFLFVALAATVSILLIGLLPAWRATSKSISDQIKSGSYASSGARSKQDRRSLLPRVLMSFEVALALIIVAGAGLLATSLSRLYHAGLGFEPNGLVNLSLDMSKQSLDGDALARWYQSYKEALQHQPGVKSVSYESLTPLTNSYMSITYNTPFSNGNHYLYMTTIAPDYFQTMRIPVLTGREFQWNDTKATGLKIVLNQTAARQLFPGRNPIGQRVIGWENVPYEVIAVVGDVRYATVRDDAPAGAYVPLTQSRLKKQSYSAVVRLDGPAAPLATAARNLIARMAPEIPAPVMTTMSGNLDASISAERMMAMLSVFFAVCALLVTAIGLYGTLAYATARRTNEIGIRMALGSRRAQVVALIFRENAWIAIAGSCAGLIAALFASRVLSSLLYGISPRDPFVLIGSVAALIAIASSASLLPALRAARIDPMQALRAE
jgi:predicted permease